MEENLTDKIEILSWALCNKCTIEKSIALPDIRIGGVAYDKMSYSTGKDDIDGLIVFRNEKTGQSVGIAESKLHQWMTSKMTHEEYCCCCGKLNWIDFPDVEQLRKSYEDIVAGEYSVRDRHHFMGAAIYADGNINCFYVEHERNHCSCDINKLGDTFQVGRIGRLGDVSFIPFEEYAGMKRACDYLNEKTRNKVELLAVEICGKCRRSKSHSMTLPPFFPIGGTEYESVSAGRMKGEVMYTFVSKDSKTVTMNEKDTVAWMRSTMYRREYEYASLGLHKLLQSRDLKHDSDDLRTRIRKTYDRYKTAGAKKSKGTKITKQ